MKDIYFMLLTNAFILLDLGEEKRKPEVSGESAAALKQQLEQCPTWVS